MTKDQIARFLSITTTAIVIGLLVAKFPGILEKKDYFSNTGFLVGLGGTVLAYILSRPIVKKADEDSIGTPLDRVLMKISFVLFLITLILFTLFVYTKWEWTKMVLFFTITSGAIIVMYLAWYPRAK
jgi:hypothetical protein